MDSDIAPSQSGEYLILAGSGTAELRVSGSRFLGLAVPAKSEEEVAELLTKRAREYHDATHHCWAAITSVQRREQSSDAGEPHGTAGQPILRAIRAAKLTDALVIVTRYFGGTKLGKGNLARAYGDCAAETLYAAPKKLIQRRRKFLIELPFDEIGKLYTLVHRTGWEIVPLDSTEGGLFEVRVPISETDVQRQVLDATAGKANIKEDGFWISS